MTTADQTHLRRSLVSRYLPRMHALLLLALAATPDPKDLDALYPSLDALYRDLHQSPELSRKEEKTAAKLAARLKALGVSVTAKVGGQGLVGVMANGEGPVVLVRTDLDGLPLEEKTGLPYASKVTATDAAGQKVGVMHACGHDLHMTAWLGTATLLAKYRSQWKGTVVLVGQGAEEVGDGARAMLADGLLDRFPRPTAAVALHDYADLPAGKVALVSGYALANVDSMDLTLFGRGGHGAYPHKTVDPVVIAAKVIVSLQTLVSRETSPLDPAVVTVGSIHGGTTYNIIPDEVRLQLTVRSYTPETRQALREGVLRIAKAEAEGARAPKPPELKIDPGPAAVFNDPGLTDRLSGALKRELGAENVTTIDKVMGAEDFGEYGKAGHFPSVLVWVGAVEPGRYAEAKAKGEPLPALHSSQFAPDRERAIRTAVRALTAATLELLGKP